MPTFTTAVYDAQKPDRANPSRLALPNAASGNIEYVVVPYTLLGTEVANDIINLCILPVDAIPIPQLSHVYSADPGTTLTAHVGTAADVDGWANGLVLSAGGRVDFTSGTAPAWLTKTPIVADTGTFTTAGSAVVFATVASANTLTASVVLYFVLAYMKQK